MKYFRNRYIRKSLILQLVFGIAVSIGGFLIQWKIGAGVAVTAIMYTAFSMSEKVAHQKKLENIAENIDTILYQKSTYQITNAEEGELSILESQIEKLVIRLREQADTLKKDKNYLADSLADISHQIRTPLTSINLIAEFMREPELTYEERLRHLRDMEKLLKQIEWEVNVLLKISKLDAGVIKFQKAVFSVSEMLEKMALNLAIPLELRGQDLILDGEKEVFITGDLAWTSEAILNILKNGMEHTQNGGTIWVHYEENTLYTQIVITDTGKGLSEEDIAHLFDRFYKGKNSSRESIGIGMALAKTIILRQNGTIRAANAREGGAQFTIRFYKKATI